LEFRNNWLRFSKYEQDISSRTCKVDTLRSLRNYWEVWIEKERWVGKVDGKSNLAQYTTASKKNKLKKIKELICIK